MTTTATASAALVAAEPVFSSQERLALVGFLARWRRSTSCLCARAREE
jgi:hypothetical protein